MALLFAISCANDPIIYDGPARVSFAIIKASFQVKDLPNQTLTIPLTTTVPFAEATTIKLIVIPGEAGTVNGTQFQCPESIVFPAGVYSDTLTITGFYDALITGKKYTFTLAIDSTVLTIQGNNKMAIDLARFCPLEIADFVGTATADDGGISTLFGMPPYAIELVEDSDANDATLAFLYFFLCEPGDAGYPMSITFDEDTGTVTIPATDVFKVNVGLAVPVMLHICGNAANKDAPIVGTFNACERTIEFSYAVVINDTAAGGNNGYSFGTYPVVITMD
ncbi:MAG: hypothetical protein LBF19_06345 [Prevotellaceae bacterium]|nr:hypothetical protein [Prevotellaceae bacterium]